jgi:hypothetical protein
MREDIETGRRRFLGSALITMAGARFWHDGSLAHVLRREGAGASPSFDSLKQIDAGVLNVGYAEAGPVDGPAVILLHGWPYDIHASADVVLRCLPDLIDLVWTARINPGKVFDLTLPLEQALEGYRAMGERRALKTLLTFLGLWHEYSSPAHRTAWDSWRRGGWWGRSTRSCCMHVTSAEQVRPLPACRAPRMS